MAIVGLRFISSDPENQPFLKPILKTATASLSAVSGEVIDTHDQYEVFNDPRAVRCAQFWKVIRLKLVTVRPHAFLPQQRSFC